MITKAKIGFRGSRRNYDSSDYDYVGDGIMINSNQRRRLIEIYHQNFQDRDDREFRISSLEDLTSLEAQELILDFETASWNCVR